jgi:hypothetical protein
MVVIVYEKIRTDDHVVSKKRSRQENDDQTL